MIRIIWWMNLLVKFFSSLNLTDVFSLQKLVNYKRFLLTPIVSSAFSLQFVWKEIHFAWLTASSAFVTASVKCNWTHKHLYVDNKMWPVDKRTLYYLCLCRQPSSKLPRNTTLYSDTIIWSDHNCVQVDFGAWEDSLVPLHLQFYPTSPL